MKFLTFLTFPLLLFLTLAFFFFKVGIIKSSVNYGHEVTINKPLQEALAVTIDESKFDQCH